MIDIVGQVPAENEGLSHNGQVLTGMKYISVPVVIVTMYQIFGRWLLYFSIRASTQGF